MQCFQQKSEGSYFPSILKSSRAEFPSLQALFLCLLYSLTVSGKIWWKGMSPLPRGKASTLNLVWKAEQRVRSWPGFRGSDASCYIFLCTSYIFPWSLQNHRTPLGVCAVASLSTHQVVKEANCVCFSRVNLSLWELSFLGMMASGSYLLLSLHLAIEWYQECLREQHFLERPRPHTRTHTRWWAAVPSPWGCLQDLALNVAEGSHATVQQNVARYILTVSVFVPRACIRH